MKRGPTPTLVRDLDILYQVGTIGGLTDRELLGQFTMRDALAAQHAFEAIVHRHGPMVLGVCHRVLRDLHAAEDAFQATFVVLALKAGTIRKPDALGSWLHGVACRISRRARVLSHRQGERQLAPGSLAFCAPEGSEIDLAELRSVLDAEVDRLPAAYRRAVVLCYLEGKTQEDVARELGWSKGPSRAAWRERRICSEPGSPAEASRPRRPCWGGFSPRKPSWRQSRRHSWREQCDLRWVWSWAEERPWPRRAR
jgi:RNA polymerase sigma factor (sigma-70 family)